MAGLELCLELHLDPEKPFYVHEYWSCHEYLGMATPRVHTLLSEDLRRLLSECMERDTSRFPVVASSFQGVFFIQSHPPALTKIHCCFPSAGRDALTYQETTLVQRHKNVYYLWGGASRGIATVPSHTPVRTYCRARQPTVLHVPLLVC